MARSTTGEPRAAEKSRALETRTERLKGRVAIVTGADSGIGQAIAVAFAKEGASVAIPVHEDEEGAEATRREVERAGGKAAVARLDQSDAQAVRRFFDEIRAELGTPDLLVNNAGVDSTGKHVRDMSDDDWDREIRTNLYGPFYCTREFLKGLLPEAAEEAGRAEAVDEEAAGRPARGVIINITSVHDEVPRAGASGYCAAKGALKNLTRCLALELATRNVRVVNIGPGMVLTPFNEQAIEDDAYRKKTVESIPMKRAADPSEIAKAAVFLASDDASYVHGTTLYVDGGLMQNQGQGA